jgi:hypothetical protein
MRFTLVCSYFQSFLDKQNNMMSLNNICSLHYVSQKKKLLVTPRNSLPIHCTLCRLQTTTEQGCLKAPFQNIKHGGSVPPYIFPGWLKVSGLSGNRELNMIPNTDQDRILPSNLYMEGRVRVRVIELICFISYKGGSTMTVHTPATWCSINLRNTTHELPLVPD